MTHSLAAIDPFYAACLSMSASPAQAGTAKPIYARLPLAPVTASPVPLTQPVRRVRIGPATLYNGDCFDIMSKLEAVEGVVTDPPYGIGFKYRTYDDAPRSTPA